MIGEWQDSPLFMHTLSALKATFSAHQKKTTFLAEGHYGIFNKAFQTPVFPGV